MPVAALAGAVGHARSHVENGVDIVIAQGYEAGGHTGEIASMVLVPEIVDAVGDSAAVLAAGGIGSGRQIAAALALGASGVWMGSYWLTTAEYKLGVPPTVRRRSSGRCSAPPRPTPCARGSTPASRPDCSRPSGPRRGPSRDAPDPLPMPLQNILVSEAHQRISAADDPEVVAMPVGQIVGRMNEIRPVAEIMAELVEGFESTVARLDSLK